MATMGEKIREARLQRGLTQGDLAEDLVTPSLISQIEANKTKPSFPLLMAIADRLGVPVEHFLNDLEDQFELETLLRIADYYLLMNQPAQAEDALSKANPPAPPGLQYQEYQLCLAKACRLQQRIHDAIHVLEDLREVAIRQQDRHLLFTVHKESGYCEFAIDNLQGAMMEWEKAVTIGESMPSDSDWPTVDLHTELAELYLCLYRLQLRLGNSAKAEEYASRASERTAHTTRFRDLAQSLMQDGMHALSQGDSGRAKFTVERALMILKAARMVQTSIYANAVDGSYRQDSLQDPWFVSAFATVSADPYRYLNAEIQHISSLLQHGHYTEALHRVEHCLQYLETLRHDEPRLADWLGGYRHRLCCEQARIYVLQGDGPAGMRLFAETAAALEANGLVDSFIYVASQWIQCAGASGQTEEALRVAERLQEVLAARQNRALRLG